MVATSGDLAGSPAHAAPSLRRWLATALSAFVGLGLLVLAVPRTIGAWHAIEGNDVYQALALGRSPANDRLDAAISCLDLALEWVPSGERFYMRASAEWERYRRLPTTDPARNEVLARIVRDLKHVLSANPADGRASLMLSVVLASQGAPARQVVVALLHSMDTVPNLRDVWLWRATYLFAAWTALAPDEAASVRGQLRAIWRNAPSLRLPLLQAALAAGRDRELALSLVDEPDSRVEFEQLKASLSSRR